MCREHDIAYSQNNDLTTRSWQNTRWDGAKTECDKFDSWTESRFRSCLGSYENQNENGMGMKTKKKKPTKKRILPDKTR